MHLHSRSDRSVGYLLFMRRSVCHCRAKPIYWTVSLGRSVNKTTAAFLASAVFDAVHNLVPDLALVAQAHEGSALRRSK